jgi:hypothetical protein
MGWPFSVLLGFSVNPGSSRKPVWSPPTPYVNASDTTRASSRRKELDIGVQFDFYGLPERNNVIYFGARLIFRRPSLHPTTCWMRCLKATDTLPSVNDIAS